MLEKQTMRWQKAAHKCSVHEFDLAAAIEEMSPELRTRAVMGRIKAASDALLDMAATAANLAAEMCGAVNGHFAGPAIKENEERMNPTAPHWPVNPVTERHE